MNEAKIFDPDLARHGLDLPPNRPGPHTKKCPKLRPKPMERVPADHAEREKDFSSASICVVCGQLRIQLRLAPRKPRLKFSRRADEGAEKNVPAFFAFIRRRSSTRDISGADQSRLAVLVVDSYNRPTSRSMMRISIC